LKCAKIFTEIKITRKKTPNKRRTKNMVAGSLKAIFYEFCKFLDEIIHALNLDNNLIAYHFCQWSHRKD
jgi:hypothetical protein